jgi:hypothetical protein
MAHDLKPARYMAQGVPDITHGAEHTPSCTIDRPNMKVYEEIVEIRKFEFIRLLS